jgi:NAD-dependent DNA ligase
MQELEQLFDLWTKASELYYNSEELLISDERFDEITEILLLDEHYSNLIKTKIQSHVNGLVDVSVLESVMLSLKKIKFDGSKSISEIKKFLSHIGGDFYYSPKFDGMAIKVINIEGFKKVITRGGQDVSQFLIDHKDIKNITRPVTHGELVITQINFDTHYVDIYANKRNCVLGVMKSNDIHLDFIELTDGVNHLLNSPWVKPFNDFINLESHYRKIRTNLPYLLDGIVISKFVDTQTIKDNYPTNSVAIKFKSGTVNTEVVDIIYSQKKTGALIPVFQLKPVLLDGTTITKASAYNYQSMITQGIGIGSIVSITKSGDIIPIIVKVIKKSIKFKLPSVAHYSQGVNLHAVDQQESKEYKFELAFNLLQIDGFGTVMANEVGKVLNFDIIELFNQKYRPVYAGMLSEINYNKFKSVYDIKSIPLDLVINLLQFNGCGNKTSKRVAEILTAVKGQIVDTKNLSQNVKDNILRGSGFTKIIESKNKLVSYGVGVTKPLIVTSETITFEMTGSAPNKMSKTDFKDKLATMYQGTLHTTLNKDTKVLFVDSYSTNSGKMNKARKNNVKIISYEDVLSGKIKLD